MIRFVVSAAVAGSVIVMLSAGGRSSSTSAQTDPIISVDALPGSGNTATAVGTIDPTLSATCGAAFKVDVVIQGITNIAGFQADLLYNPAVLKVTAVDYAFLLTSTGTAVVDVGNPTPDVDGSFRLAAAMFSIGPYVGANGDGVLARMTLQAVGSGSSALDLTSVKMSDANAVPIPPTDVNDFYTGPVADASISVVGSSCAVGGVAEPPGVAGASLEVRDSPGANAGFPAAAAAAAGVGALTVGGGAWYARRRWLR